jgi:PAS domain S-box-containing protein
VPAAWSVALLIYSVLIYGQIVQGVSAMWVTDIAWTLSAAVTTFGCFRAALRSRNEDRTAWLLFGCAFGCWLLGQLIWDWQELVLAYSVPFPSASDAFFTAFGIISIAALFALRDPLPALRMTARNVGNFGLIICSLAVAMLTALYEPMIATDRTLAYVTIALIEATSIISAFVFSVYFLWSHRWGTHTNVLTLVVLSYAVHGSITLFYVHSLIISEFGASHYLNAAWILAMGLQHWASCEQVHVARGAATISSDALFARERRVEALLPGLLLLALVVAAAAFHEHLTPRVLRINIVLIGLFAIILLARESWMYSRERRLKSLLQSSTAQVDEAQRTLEATLAELRATEERLRLTASAGNVGLFEHDLLTGKVSYSSHYKRQLGWEDADIGDTLDEWNQRVHGDDRDKVVAEVDEAITVPGKEIRVEHRLRHRNGHYRWFLAQATVRRAENGEPLAVVGSQVDITRLKKTEQALRDSEARYRELAAQLEVRVTERTAQLQDAYLELEGFAYAVSHDLKAPLRAIDGYSHLLEQSAREKLSPEEHAYVERLRTSALRMAALIDGLLAYSRVERRELHIVEVKLDEIINEALVEQEPILANRHLSLTCEVPEVTLFVDREALLIVMRNLIDNSVKFTRRQASPMLDIQASVRDGRVTIEVRDNGIGFDPAYHDKIFTIFNRLDASTEYEGTGAGLALARKAVQRMNGRLWATSELGQGATFFVEIPIGVGMPL